MFKSLLVVAARNLRKDKWYSLINITGLMIGITFSLFLIFYIVDELSFDRYNVKASRIYRVAAYVKEADHDENHNASTQYALVPELQKDFPDAEQAVRLVGQGKVAFSNGDRQFYVNKVYAADSNLFEVFTYQFIEGNPRNALMEPYSIVLTQSIAEKYFGKNKSVVGKAMRSDAKEYRVTGVIKDIPRNSHILFDALISMSTIEKYLPDDWGSFGAYSYVLLRPGASAPAFDKKMLSLSQKFIAPVFAQFNVKIHYGLQPLTSIHLRSDMGNEPEQLGSMSYIYIFSAVAAFLLLIACVNYMNLTTARSARRAKEIGIRKVTGSTRGLLIAQFLFESVLTAFIAFVLGIVLFALFLPTFNLFSGKSLELSALLEPQSLVMLFCVVVFVGLIGGTYPALYLSKFNPVSMLKGSLSKGSSNATLRRVLVIFQFSICMTMLICTWIVYNQLQYLSQKDLGFKKDRVMVLTVNGNASVPNRIAAFTDELRKNPGILSLSTSQSVPGSAHSFNLFSIQTKDGFAPKGVANYAVDENYIKTLGMKMAAGRDFSGLADTMRKILVNEAMAKEYGWDQPIGKQVKFPGDTSSFHFEVVGVVKDFNQAALYDPIAPLILFYRPNNFGVEVKLNAQNFPQIIAYVEKTWKASFPEIPFSFKFLDKDFDSQYSADEKRGEIFMTFSIITVSITCLGLLGLIAFVTGQRKKEISIRKVMGAQAGQIILLLLGNFLVMAALSCLIAFPVAAWFMDKWLHLFYYNTGLTATPFLYSGLIVLVITTTTVAFHTVRSAVANPVNGLRSE